MSELCIKFQIPVSNELRRQGSTIKFKGTAVRTDKVKLYAPPHFVAGGGWGGLKITRSFYGKRHKMRDSSVTFNIEENCMLLIPRLTLFTINNV